jgi:hypothetical protein
MIIHMITWLGAITMDEISINRMRNMYMIAERAKQKQSHAENGGQPVLRQPLRGQRRAIR